MTAPVRILWHIARRSWVSIDPGLRPRSGASALLLFLFLIFLVVGIILRLLGFDLADIDRWLDAQGGWLNGLGSLAFRGLCGLIFLACVGTLGAGIVQRFMRPRGKTSRRKKAGDRRGNPEKTEDLGCIAAGTAAVIGYFAWFGMVN